MSTISSYKPHYNKIIIFLTVFIIFSIVLLLELIYNNNIININKVSMCFRQ